MKVKSQLFWNVFLIGSVMTIAITIFAYYEVKKMLLKNSFDHLQAISETKARRIKSIVEERFATGNIFAEDILSKIDTTTKSFCQKNSCRQELNQIITYYVLRIKKIKTITILNDSGRVITSTDSSVLKSDFPDNEFFKLAKIGTPFISRFNYDKDELHASISIPLKINDRFIGVLILEEEFRNITVLTDDYTGLGNQEKLI